MTLTLQPETEARILAAALMRGQSADDVIRDLLPALTALELLRLPKETRDALLRAQAEATVALYEDDLGRPDAERRLIVPASGDVIEPEVYLNGV